MGVNRLISLLRQKRFLLYIFLYIYSLSWELNVNKFKLFTEGIALVRLLLATALTISG